MSTEAEGYLTDAKAICDLFEKAADANLNTAGRGGSVVDLPDKGRVILTGDLHDHPLNFERILKLARINYSTNYHVVFHEVIHGGNLVDGHDLSYQQLARIAHLKVEKPDQIHPILSNHEMAQFTGECILKDGVAVVDAFNLGLMHVFGDQWEQVQLSISRYLRTMAIAVRCANGVMCAHSLPSPHHRDMFDTELLDRRLTVTDMCGPFGSAHLMVWGRGLAQTTADELGAAWKVKVFVLGHQYVSTGWKEVGQSMLVLNSDHDNGVAVDLDLGETYTRDSMLSNLVYLHEVELASSVAAQ